MKQSTSPGCYGRRVLVELAIGDAYGAGFEYAKPHFVETNNTTERFVAHPTHELLPGRYTDDTQMSVALAEVLASGLPFTRANLAEAFVTVYKRDPRAGYARGFAQFLTEVSDGAEFLARIRPDSDKSGAAMRAPPLGVLANTAEVIARAEFQARLTHDTRDGVNAAIAAALASHFCIYELGALEELGTFVSDHVEGQWAVPWSGAVGEKGWMSVRAAITALSRATSMRELLRECVAFTGDVDTVATIALAAGSCCSAIEQDLPASLTEGLENGAYGRDWLAELDVRLLALINRP